MRMQQRGQGDEHQWQTAAPEPSDYGVWSILQESTFPDNMWKDDHSPPPRDVEMRLALVKGVTEMSGWAGPSFSAASGSSNMHR